MSANIYWTILLSSWIASLLFICFWKARAHAHWRKKKRAIICLMHLLIREWLTTAVDWCVSTQPSFLNWHRTRTKSRGRQCVATGLLLTRGLNSSQQDKEKNTRSKASASFLRREDFEVPPSPPDSHPGWQGGSVVIRKWGSQRVSSLCTHPTHPPGAVIVFVV